MVREVEARNSPALGEDELVYHGAVVNEQEALGKRIEKGIRLIGAEYEHGRGGTVAVRVQHARRPPGKGTRPPAV